MGREEGRLERKDMARHRQGRAEASGWGEVLGRMCGTGKAAVVSWRHVLTLT